MYIALPKTAPSILLRLTATAQTTWSAYVTCGGGACGERHACPLDRVYLNTSPRSSSLVRPEYFFSSQDLHSDGIDGQHQRDFFIILFPSSVSPLGYELSTYRNLPPRAHSLSWLIQHSQLKARLILLTCPSVTVYPVASGKRVVRQLCPSRVGATVSSRLRAVKYARFPTSST